MTPPSQRSAVKAPGRTLRSGTGSAWLAAILAGVLGSTVGFGRIEAATAAGGHATGGHRAGASAAPPPLKAPGGNSPPAQQGQEQGPKEAPRPSQPPRPVSPLGSKNGRNKARPDQEQGLAEAVPGAELTTDTRHEESMPSIGNATESPIGITAEPNGRRVRRGQVSRSLKSPLDPESRDTDEEAWLERWRTDRDEAAFAWVMARHGPCLLAQARRFVDWHHAQDIVQETFRYLWEKDPEIRSPAHLVALLRRVVHNLGLNCRRKANRVELVDPQRIDGEERSLSVHEPTAYTEFWNYAAGLLSGDQLETLELRVRDGLTLREVSDRMGIPVWKLRRMLRAAKDIFRKAKIVRSILVC
jgi:RNA polymerase sigma factor (sigma-70 family)